MKYFIVLMLSFNVAASNVFECNLGVTPSLEDGVMYLPVIPVNDDQLYTSVYIRFSGDETGFNTGTYEIIEAEEIRCTGFIRDNECNGIKELICE